MSAETLNAEIQKFNLAKAIDRFNTACGYRLALPIARDELKCVAELAAMRGRRDIAQAILEAMP